MGLTIACECGAVVRADTEEDLVAAARAHIARAHRAAAGVVTQSDLLAMARRTVEPALPHGAIAQIGVEPALSRSAIRRCPGVGS
jgi:hypothetical protein